MSDKPTESSPLDREFSRRELLKKAGQVGAGALVAGSVAGAAAAASKRVRRVGKKVPTGGTVTWALEQDPGGIYPFGATLTINHTANELMYDSLLEWDPKLNLKPALAASYDVVNSKRIIFNLKKGIQFHNGQEFTATDAKYSFDQILNPPLPGTTATIGQVPGIAGTTALSKYKLQMDLKAPDARVYGFLAWGRYSAMVPNNMYQNLNPSTSGVGTGPTVYQKWFTGWNGAPQSNPKPIWRLVGNGRITLDTQKRLPMYHKLDNLLIDELVEIPLISVSKFFVVNKRLKNMYVAFTDFNPALRTAYVVST
jgi:ABC-type transport system substrate-binding protein